MNNEIDDPWFEGEDDDRQPDKPEPEPSSKGTGKQPEGFNQIFAGFLGEKDMKRLADLLGVKGLIEQEAEEPKRTTEEEKIIEEIESRAVKYAKGQSGDDLSQLWVVITTALLMQAHCEDCMKQLAKAMIETLRDTPFKQTYKKKEEYGIATEE